MTNYKIIKQNRKTASIHISDDLEVVIKIPKYTGKKEIESFILKYEEWIQKRLEEKRVINEKTNWIKTKKILYLDEYREIDILYGTSRKSEVLFKENRFTITVLDDTHEEELRKLMEGFFRKQAKIKLEKLTTEYTSLLKVTCNRVTIRKQKTRWGSCSSKGNIAYNVRLLGASEKIIAYVVLHEVMHLKIFNHSKAFWSEIQAIMPDYKERMNDLRQFGQNFSL